MQENEENRTPLKVVVFPRGIEGIHVAVCLDHYIVGRGRSPHEAFRDLKWMVEAERAYGDRNRQAGNPLEAMPRAPDEYWRMFIQEGAHEYIDGYLIWNCRTHVAPGSGHSPSSGTMGIGP